VDERTISWADADLGVAWPLEGREPTLSEKDSRGAAFREAEVYL
jgi:dTDP-4-dehydrorhamnose 3,5-epimerase